jgi:hypothetical protein
MPEGSMMASREKCGQKRRPGEEARTEDQVDNPYFVDTCKFRHSRKPK